MPTVGKKKFPYTEKGKAAAKEARKAQEKTEKTAKLGSGARFKAVEKVAAASGAKNPAAIAAKAGMMKYGKEKMVKMAKAGKKKK